MSTTAIFWTFSDTPLPTGENDFLRLEAEHYIRIARDIIYTRYIM